MTSAKRPAVVDMDTEPASKKVRLDAVVTPSLTDLPPELLAMILQRLPLVTDLRTAMLVNRRWRDVVQQDLSLQTKLHMVKVGRELVSILEYDPTIVSLEMFYLSSQLGFLHNSDLIRNEFHEKKKFIQNSQRIQSIAQEYSSIRQEFVSLDEEALPILKDYLDFRSKHGLLLLEFRQLVSSTFHNKSITNFLAVQKKFISIKKPYLEILQKASLIIRQKFPTILQKQNRLIEKLKRVKSQKTKPGRANQQRRLISGYKQRRGGC